MVAACVITIHQLECCWCYGAGISGSLEVVVVVVISGSTKLLLIYYDANGHKMG